MNNKYINNSLHCVYLYCSCTLIDICNESTYFNKVVCRRCVIVWSCQSCVPCINFRSDETAQTGTRCWETGVGG